MLDRSGRPASTLDRARERPQIDPRSHIPNPNPPVGTVGPNVPAGFGDTHVMYPEGGWHAEAWAGWPTDWGTPWYEHMGGGSGDWSGFGYGRHDPAGYLDRVSLVMTSVDRNSSQLASFPLYGVDGLETEELPSWAQNPMPGLYSDWSDFALEAANSLMLDGEAIIWASERFADGYPARFMCLPAREVDIEFDRERGRFVYTWDGGELRTADVCHVRYQKIAGQFRGVGPLQWLLGDLADATALAAYSSDIAKHGVWAVLSNPANLNAAQREDAKANWMAARAGRPGAPAVLSGQWEFNTTSLSPKDMALLDLRTLSDQRIIAAFRLFPWLVSVEQPGSMTYSNVHQIGDLHWRIALRPLAKKFATALSAWAIPGKRRLEFDRDEYVQPGFGERAAAYAVMHGIENQDGEHAMTVDEIRVRERFDPKHPENLEGREPVLIGENP